MKKYERLFCLMIAVPAVSVNAWSGPIISAGDPAPSTHDSGDQVISDPAIAAIFTVMSQQRSCTAMASRDVHFLCTGALPPVDQPTIVPNTCFFNLAIQCAGETALISGNLTSYELESPEGQSVALSQNTAPIVQVSSVQFK